MKTYEKKAEVRGARLQWRALRRQRGTLNLGGHRERGQRLTLLLSLRYSAGRPHTAPEARRRRHAALILAGIHLATARRAA